MANYAITGDLGAGKGLFAVDAMRTALLQGRRVATNFDLDLSKLLPSHNRASAIRVPDYPSVEDLELIGCGNDSYDETKNGLLVLDELGAWFNSRDFQDKGRKDFLRWLIHARKKGWDCFFLMQNEIQVDKQLRESLFRYFVRCSALRGVDIPFIGKLIRFVSLGVFSGKLPHMHMAVTRLGSIRTSMLITRDYYQGKDLYAGYDTRQEFSPLYENGAFSMLSSWHVVGRYLPPPPPRWFRILCALFPFMRSLSITHSRKALPDKKPVVLALMRFPADYRWHKARDLIQRGII